MDGQRFLSLWAEDIDIRLLDFENRSSWGVTHLTACSVRNALNAALSSSMSAEPLLMRLNLLDTAIFRIVAVMVWTDLLPRQTRLAPCAVLKFYFNSLTLSASA